MTSAGRPRTPSRRAVLRGALATGGLVATGCGLGDGEPGRLVALFDPRGGGLVAGQEQRVPLGLADASGLLRSSGPDVLQVRVEDDEGVVVADVTVERHDDGLEQPYWPVRFTPERPVTYAAVATVHGAERRVAFVVGTRADGRLPHERDYLPSIDTPTVGDAAGVDPICTREPVCPLHDRSLEDVLETAPLALLVASPGDCGGPVCWPVLDLLLDVVPAHPDVVAIHAEVYRDAALVADLEDALPSPTVHRLGLTFAPSLFLVDADRRVVERLDHVWDRRELDAAMARLTRR